MTYDANGNMMTKGTQALAYDAENRLIAVTGSPAPGGEGQGEGVTTSFVYDGDGGRVQKVTAAGATTYIGKLWEVRPDGTTVKYVWAGSQRLASKSSTGALLFYAPNHLGSTDLVTDAQGTQVAHYEYLPYGEVFSTEGLTVPHLYTGKERDPETGFYFYEARYYDPQLGRFLTPDTIVPNWTNPQDFNRYTYANNNPLKYTDPTGHKSFWKKVGNFFKKAWQTVVSVVAVVAAPFTAGQSLWILAGLQVYNGVQAIQNGQFGSFLAGLAVSAALGGFSPLNFGNLFMQVGIGALRGAAIGAISGGVASAISGGSFGAGAAAGAIGGAIGGGVSAFATSQQFTNWKAGNGFVSNATLAAQQAGQGGNLQGLADKEYRLSINVKEGATGKAQLGRTGHAWVTLEDGENTTSYGYWPDGLHATNGYYDGMVPDSSLTYVVSKAQYGNAVQYVNNVSTQTGAGNMNWSLSTNCVDFVSGAARSASIPVPSTTTTTWGVSYSDPNKLADWLVNKQ